MKALAYGLILVIGISLGTFSYLTWGKDALLNAIGIAACSMAIAWMSVRCPEEEEGD